MKHKILFKTILVLILISRFAIFSAGAVEAKSGELIKGVVFNDMNSNGVKDKGEKGLEGVAVSDGFTVVVTNKSGEYSINSNPRARFITVYTPDGYRNTNRFFTDIRSVVAQGCNDKDAKDAKNDSKELNDASQLVKKNGETKLPENILNRSNTSLNFGLTKCEVYGKFAHMSDIEDRIYAEWIDRMKEYSAIHNQDFIAVTGDICYESGLRFFSRAMNELNMGRRMVYTIGNHDLIKGNKDYLGNEYGEKVFEDCFGPAWYSFNAAGVHYIVTPMLAGDAKPSYSADDIRAWIQQDLKTIPEGTPIIMFNHNASSELIPENANVCAFVYGHHHIDQKSVRNITFSNSNGNNSGSTSENALNQVPEKNSTKSVVFYCSMSPSKGSNDHAPSALREFSLKVTDGKTEFSENGRKNVSTHLKTDSQTAQSENKGLEISTRMHYAPISNHIVAHEVNGKVRAVVYDAASEPLKAEVVLPSGERIAMTQLNDMMWEADMNNLSEAAREKGKTIARVGASKRVEPCEGVYKVAAEFSDGERIIARQEQEPGLKWMTTLPCKTFFSSPIFDNGHIYIAGIDNENSSTCALFSIDATTGAIEWSCSVKNSIKGDLALMDGVLFAGDVDHNIYAINASDGSIKWQKRVRGDGYPSFCEGVHAANGLVYMGTAAALCALDASNGETVWTNTHKHGSITNICTNKTAKGALLTNGYWVGRFCYDAATGEFLWEKKDNNNRYSSSTPAVHDSTFIYTGYSAIMQVEPRTGEVIRQGDFPGHIFNTRSEPLVIDNHIFVGTSNNGFICVNMKDMKQVWNFQSTPAIIYTSPYTQHQEKTVESSPIAYGENVIFGANDGYVYCLNRRNGQFVWSIKTGLPVICKPVILKGIKNSDSATENSDINNSDSAENIVAEGDMLIFSDFGGNIYCYHLPDVHI